MSGWSNFSGCCNWGYQLIKGTKCTNRTTVCNQFPSGMAATFEFTVAGVTAATGNTCLGSPCNSWNGTKTVTIDETPYGGSARECWLPGPFGNLSIRDAGPPATCITRGGCGWLLWYDAVSVMGWGYTGWILQANVAGNFLGHVAAYLLRSGTTFKRYGANTFDLFAGSVSTINCQGWPSEITIEPVCS